MECSRMDHTNYLLIANEKYFVLGITFPADCMDGSMR